MKRMVEIFQFARIVEGSMLVSIAILSLYLLPFHVAYLYFIIGLIVAVFIIYVIFYWLSGRIYKKKYGYLEYEKKRDFFESRYIRTKANHIIRYGFYGLIVIFFIIEFFTKIGSIYYFGLMMGIYLIGIGIEVILNIRSSLAILKEYEVVNSFNKI